MEIHAQYKGKVYISKFVSYDEASTRKILTNKIEESKGGLPVDMIALTFLCDINHRIKAMTKPFFNLAALPNRLSICNNVDAIIVKRNIGWHIRGYRNDPNKTFEDIIKNARASVAHHFNDH